MELELATTNDIINELQNRKMRFVLVGVRNSNQVAEPSTFFACQALDRKEASNLFRLGLRKFLRLNDNDLRLDRGDPI